MGSSNGQHGSLAANGCSRMESSRLFKQCLPQSGGASYLRNMTKRLFPAIIALGLAAAFQAGFLMAQIETPDTSGLIIADGWQDVQENCTECHSSLLIIQNSGTKAVWESRIRWMQGTQGLKVLASNIEESILNYLATNYGAKTFSRRAPLDVELMPQNPYQSEE